jgi:16S rRNA (adenine1518-N6/adenine1519-N6)-dimethyltransferase
MAEMDLESIASGAAGEAPIRVAGNLPYNISSPILFRLLDLRSGGRADATLMLQREVATTASPRGPQHPNN